MTKRAGQVSLRVVPCPLSRANLFVSRIHRHHGPVTFGHSLAVLDDANLVRGVAIIGRPVGANRMTDGDLVAEVSRVATDGCANACSALYGAAARLAKAAGYSRIITYILDSEQGTSLKGAGWTQDPGWYGGQSWMNRPGRKDLHPVGPKGRWSLELHPYVKVRWPFSADDSQVALFEDDEIGGTSGA